jgi:peroxiredoxin-like protein
MKPLPHLYKAHLTGGPAGYATVSSDGLPDMRVASPLEFGGPGDAWTPEHLLLASVEACFLLTLRAVARASKFEIVDLDVTVEGVVDRQAGVTRFTGIVLRPTLTVPAGADRERAFRILEKTEKACLVSASLSTPIRLEAAVNEAQAEMPAAS